VTGNYFEAMGIPLLRGRTFTAADAPDAPIAAIINEAMARRLFPSGDALGQRLLWGGRPMTIVGVAGDVHIGAIDAAVRPTIYTPIFQLVSGATARAVFIVRTQTSDPAQLAAAVRTAIWSVDRDVPVFDVRTMTDIVSRSLAARRLAAGMLAAFAGVALILAIIGLYGVLSYMVTQKMPELGVRVALGATPGQVLRLVLRQGVSLTLAGIAIGTVVGAAVGRAMSQLLFGVQAIDPITFATAIGALLAVSIVASYLPARRAAMVDPVSALRGDL
jgi:predicted permease